MSPGPIRVRFPVVPGRSHNLVNEFTDFPPEGMEYVFPERGEVGYREVKGETPPLVARMRATSLARRAYEPIVRHVMGGVGIQDRLARVRGRMRGGRDYDVFHSGGGVHAPPEPWVVSLESSLDFFGFGEGWYAEIERASSRRYAAKKLLSSHCSRILPWTEAARRSVLATFPEHAQALDEKMEVVRLAIRAGEEPPPETEGDVVRLLFVGSRNFPQDFVPKGGHIALAAHAKLVQKYDVELIVRAEVPERYRARYEGMKGLRIIDQFLSDDELNRLYRDANIFLFPTVHTPGMVIPEAMRAARAVVSTDVWANRELLGEDECGLLVQPPEGFQYLNRWKAPNWRPEEAFMRPFEENIERTVEDVVAATARLIEDASLRRRLGRAARREVVSGRLSIARRNIALKRIYEEAAGR